MRDHSRGSRHPIQRGHYSNQRGSAHRGGRALRETMRSWGVGQVVDLQAWLRGQGFPGPQPRNDISARAQEFILSEECQSDARVALLEEVFVTTTLELGRRNAPPSTPIPSAASERVRRQVNSL